MKIHTVIVLIVFGISLHAQTFDEYKKEQAKAYQDYQDSMDLEFIGYLKKQWSFVEQEEPEALYIEKKPQTLPTKEVQKPKKYVHEIIIDSKKPAVKKEIVKVITPIVVKKEIHKLIDVDYYGLTLKIPIYNKLPRSLKPIKESNDFTVFWDEMSHFNFKLTTKELNRFAKEYSLNGWSMYNIVQKFSKEIYPKKYEQQLLSWFLLNKLGYKVKVGFNNEKIVLLSATDVEVFSTLYFTINDRRYYALDYYLKEDFGSLYTYKKDFPSSNKVIDFSMKKLPLFPKEPVAKEIKYKEFNVALKLELNKHLLDYLKTFPQVGYST